MANSPISKGTLGSTLRVEEWRERSLLLRIAEVGSESRVVGYLEPSLIHPGRWDGWMLETPIFKTAKGSAIRKRFKGRGQAIREIERWKGCLSDA